MGDTVAMDDDVMLKQWVDSLDEARKALSSASGLPAAYSREDLGRMWEWMRTQCKGNTPLKDPDAYSSDVPEWATWEMEGNWRRRLSMAPETLKLVGYMARYYGECLRGAVPEAMWVIWRWKKNNPGISGEGQPALAIPLPPHAPGKYGSVTFVIRDVDVLVMRVVVPSTESTDFLLGYDMRVQELQKAVAFAKSITKL